MSDEISSTATLLGTSYNPSTWLLISSCSSSSCNFNPRHFQPIAYLYLISWRSTALYLIQHQFYTTLCLEVVATELTWQQYAVQKQLLFKYDRYAKQQIDKTFNQPDT